MLIHTGAEKLKCDLCDRAFIRKQDLKQHMFSHTQYVTSLLYSDQDDGSEIKVI